MKRLILWSLAGSALYLGYLVLTDEPELQRVLDQADRSLPPLPTALDVAGKIDPMTQRVPDAMMAKQAIGAVRDSNHLPKAKLKKSRSGAANRTQKQTQTATDDRENAPTQVAAIKALNESLTPTSRNAPQPARQPWIQSLSGAQASFSMAKDSEQGPKCATSEQCPGSHEDSGISVIGVVVDTKKMARPVHSLVEGRLGIGDARKTPAVYVH